MAGRMCVLCFEDRLRDLRHFKKESSRAAELLGKWIKGIISGGRRSLFFSVDPNTASGSSCDAQAAKRGTF